MSKIDMCPRGEITLVTKNKAVVTGYFSDNHFVLSINRYGFAVEDIDELMILLQHMKESLE